MVKQGVGTLEKREKEDYMSSQTELSQEVTMEVRVI